jgi:hypothetical protein
MAGKSLEEYQEERFKKLSAHMRSEERELVLKPIGRGPLSTAGLVDSRLFTGENNLRVLKDPITNLWIFKYRSGITPAPLRQKFTSYASLMTFAEGYFGRRNIVIEKVID